MSSASDRDVSRNVRTIMAGAASGIVGTAVMTLLMKPGLAGYVSERWRPAEFVPKQIIEWAERQLAGGRVFTERQEQVAAAIAHAGYGAMMGAVYALLRGSARRPPPAVSGALWGVVVWLFGYEGWLPAGGVRPATTVFPPTRWPLPIVNHIVFGIVTALLTAAIDDGATDNIASSTDKPVALL